ncbi:MAG: DUF2231 domain-containing protein [bacterium]
MLSPEHFHPMLVHFPIALIIVGFLADLFSLFIKKEPCLSKIGYYLEILGMLAALAAWGTGYFLTSPLEGEAGLLREKHELFATLTLVTIVIATIARIILVYIGNENTNYKYIPLALFFLAFIFVSYTGFLGGSLVIEYL